MDYPSWFGSGFAIDFFELSYVIIQRRCLDWYYAKSLEGMGGRDFMKKSSKVFLLMGAVAAGVLAHKYVADHKEELDRFINEYGEMMEEEYQEEKVL